ncbi:MAG: hypothetical protein V3V78_04165 [Candidatus Woesearchaeota archaeon]
MYYKSPSQDVVKNLFYNQIRKATRRCVATESFDIQFSDSWI